MVDTITKAFVLALMLLLPLLGITMLVSVIISVIQAATSVQEMTLTFVPKFIITLLILIVAGPWMLQMLVGFTTDIFVNLPNLVP